MFTCLRMAFYAVAKGRQPGIFRSWAECENQVKGFGGAIFKKFKSQQEANAFIDGQPPAKKLKIQTKINFSKAIDKISTQKGTKAKQKDDIEDQESYDSDDKRFLSLEEHKDGPPSHSASKKKPRKVPSTSSVASEPKSNDPLGIKFEPPEPTKQKSYSGHFFNEDRKGFVHVYTDGSCESNGQYAAAAGLGVYFGENHSLNVSEPVTGRPTNNAGEIQAAIRAIQDAQRSGVKKLKIFTDSQFLIKSVCKWMVNWKKKDWKLATGKKVVNVKDFQQLDQLIESGNMLIKWSYIPAHKGYDGNEKADQLAKIGAGMYRSKRQKANDEHDGSDSEQSPY